MLKATIVATSEPEIDVAPEDVGVMADKLAEQNLNTTYRDTDRMFVYLMAVQWLGGIFLAVKFSPLTWSGAHSSIHPHIWAAIIIGGGLSLLAGAGAIAAPGKTSTRHIIAVCQMLYSALLIDLTNGRIETHFHVFGSLAFLAFYRDWRVLITGSVIVAADHMLRGIYAPATVYGVATAAPWRWLEHAAWVAFEDAFLIMGIARSLREMRKIAYQHARLMTTETSLRSTSAERERLLREISERDRDQLTELLNHRSFQHLLDSLIREPDGAFCVAILDLDNFKFFNDAYGHAEGDKALKEMAAFLVAGVRATDVVTRFGSDEFVVVMPKTGVAQGRRLIRGLTEKLHKTGYRVEGSVIPMTATAGMVSFPQDGKSRQELLENLSERLRRAKLNQETDADVEALRRSLSTTIDGFPMLDSLLTMVDNKDRYTRRHSEDVMTYCLQIAEQLGMSDAELQNIRIAALLHDIGKIGVPDAILRKPGKLTDEEFEAVKRHPVMGAIIVGAVPGLEMTIDAVRHHHERWDGKGYPDGLAGIQCPLSARLMAVADAFSAMTTDRPYRNGMPREKALDILEQGAGTQWDPECVEAFLNACRPAKKSTKSLQRAA